MSSYCVGIEVEKSVATGLLVCKLIHPVYNRIFTFLAEENAKKKENEYKRDILLSKEHGKDSCFPYINTDHKRTIALDIEKE
jgi:hypothetical protein